MRLEVEQLKVKSRGQTQLKPPVVTIWTVYPAKKAGVKGEAAENQMFSIVCVVRCARRRTPQFILERQPEICTQGEKNISTITNPKKVTVLYKHQVEKHEGLPADCNAEVTNKFWDCLSRQVSEAVEIRGSGPSVLNSKPEGHQPAKHCH